MKIEMTETELWTAINALRVAALQYATDANVHASEPRLKAQFLAQATRANEVADKIEAQS